MQPQTADAISRVWALLDANPGWGLGLASEMVRIPTVNQKFADGSRGEDITGRGAELQALLRHRSMTGRLRR